MVSVILNIERDKKQDPIYIVSQTSKRVEAHYPQLEKHVFVLIVVVRRLEPYFQVHPIHGLIDSLLK